MKSFSWATLAIVSCAVAMMTGCGGGSTKSLSNASASNARYAQPMTVTFLGSGLASGVEMRVTGPCESPVAVAGATNTSAQFTCKVTGVGQIHAALIDTAAGAEVGAIKVDVPLPRVTMTLSDGTRSGDVTLELDPRAAPKTCEQFIEYLKDGFYLRTLIHRVNPAVGILGGGFVSETDGVVSAKLPTRGELALERTGLSNVRGAVAMYHEADPNGANSMFFVNTVDNPQFDVARDGATSGYAVFARVVEGLNVIDEAAKVPVRPDLSLGVSDVPVTAVRIAAVLQTR